MKLIYSLNEKAHGTGTLTFCWQTGGNHVVTTGSDNSVHIYDRQGELVDELSMPGVVTSMAWDKDGDVIALTNNKSNVITLWDVNTRRTTQLDSSMGVKDSLTFAVWSRSSPVLAVGNSKGNILLYNHRTARKVPVLGKHQRKITCGAFSDNDLLALGGEDSSITVSNLDGDTVYSFACNAEPANIQFAEMKEAERTNQGETTISTIVGKRILMLINLNDAENPINLQFQSRYGDINTVKLRELSQLSDVYAMVEVEDEDKGLDKVALSDDGQLLAIAGNSGSLHVYLTRLPVLGDCWQNKIAVLTSLTEITVLNEVEQEAPISFNTEVEPTFIGVGPVHIAVGMNNRAWFYQLTPQGKCNSHF
uniref:Anaphase-promoting complex subunit 4 WD40 domain-containing protein n=1 Tax=Plectus sambesii TaxID=2011161 RepID=A0A914URT3_9BILA